jgi:asparagine synthase (glutamine-hydrolysing)
MCGVFGWFRGALSKSSDISLSRVMQALRRLSHRGPDGVGLTAFDAANQSSVSAKWLNWQGFEASTTTTPWPPHVQGWLGHTLLAIAAPSVEGMQPVCDPEQTLWLSFNGEIYNHPELRQQLHAEGVPVVGTGDTPVLLAWLKHKGLAGMAALNGVFAFVAYWPNTHTLWVGRDRLGTKPLYYSHAQGGVGFASEIKALLPLQTSAVRVDPHALAEILTFQNIWTPRTLVAGIQPFPAGHVAVIDLNRDVAASHWQWTAYWSPVFQQAQQGSASTPSRNVADWAAALQHHVMQAAHRQNIPPHDSAHVTRSSVLSGGLDSSTMAAGLVISDQQARRDDPHRPTLQTYTCGFASSGPVSTHSTDERPLAQAIAHALGTEHHALELSAPSLWQALEANIWALESPIMGPSAQHLVLNQTIAQQGAKVLYSGTGGDELMGGYPWRYGAIHSLTQEPVVSDGQIAEALFGQWVRVWTDTQKRALAGKALQATLADFDSRAIFNSVWQHVLDNNPLASPLAKAQCFDLHTFLPGLLQVDERLAMACSMEGRVPWLDHDLMDFALTMPDTFKLGPAQYGQRQSKYLLRQAMVGVLPQAVLSAPKRGFVPPLRQALAGPLLPQLTHLLIGTAANPSPLTEYLQPDALARLINQHAQGQVNHMRTLWTLASVATWLNVFVHSSELTVAPSGSLMNSCRC